MLLSTMFPLLDAQNMFRHLRDTAAPYGIIFADIARISNSRISLEATEFVKSTAGSISSTAHCSRHFFTEYGHWQL